MALLLLSSVAACAVPDAPEESTSTTEDSLRRDPWRHWIKKHGRWKHRHPKGPKAPPTTKPTEPTEPTEPPPATVDPEVVTGTATSLGLKAFSANGRIQPHGAPSKFYFEYGSTTAYGSTTTKKAMPPRLAAHYQESWDDGAGGWQGGSGGDLAYLPTDGVSGGTVRYSEPTGDDYNHIDGIGLIHLVQWMNPGTFELPEQPTAALGGGAPDMRDARIQVSVRGHGWKTSGSELLFWAQTDVYHGSPPPGIETNFTNWAHTGFYLTDALFSGQWETVTYRLENDTTMWTYAGANRAVNKELNRSVYVYAPLDETLSNMDVDFFHLLAFIDVNTYPEGSIDFDNLDITYRNHSLVFPSNGGSLVSAPTGSEDDPATLTDGWRSGTGRTWKSPASPKSPQEIVYEFETPVTLDRVQLHQNLEWPSRNVEILASEDGTTFTSIATGEMPATAAAGKNFAFYLQKGLREVYDRPVKRLKVRILDGYRAKHWGLGEIEVFGDGAEMETDDDWYNVNNDITGLTAGEVVHYRLVTEADGKTFYGADQVYTVPLDTKPEVATGSATRIAGGSAKLEGRMNSLGGIAQVYFEYGPTTSYGTKTVKQRKAQEITPRTVVQTITELAPGSVVHYRMVATSKAGTTYGEDRTFVAQ